MAILHMETNRKKMLLTTAKPTIFLLNGIKCCNFNFFNRLKRFKIENGAKKQKKTNVPVFFRTLYIAILQFINVCI